MKLNKIFAVALAVVTLSSCDNDTAEDYPAMLGGVNTAGGVTVSLPTTFEAKENQTLFKLPISVVGDANGKVVVTVQAKELTQLPAETESAKPVEHYNITSYTVNIPAGESEGYIEVMPVWAQGEINDNRVFELSIVKVDGASVDNVNCQVTIANIDDPYTAMYGKWKFSSAACTSSVEKEYTLTISGPASESEYYGKELYAYGLRGLNYIFLPLNFEYNKETGEKIISIQQRTLATDAVINFSGLGACVVVGCEDPSEGNFGQDIPMTYTLADDGSETMAMTDMSQSWYLAVMPYPARNEIFGQWGGWKGITLTR